jgi:sec-independent protein translocase protein TatC
MSVMDHLRELRRRVIVMVLIVAAGAIIGWIFYPQILSILKHPYCQIPPSRRFPPNSSSCDLIFFQPLAGFTTRLKVAFIAGAVITAPLWLYQIWAFVVPGLRRTERKYTLIFIAASTALFAAGVSLAYLILSKGLRVLIGAAGPGTAALLDVNSYLSFVVLMLVVFGAAFELPLLVVLANFAGALPSRWLRKSQRIAIFLIFVFAAVATPSTDPFSMTAMAVPMCLLYEGAVLIATIHDRRKARRKAEQQAAAVLADDVPSTVDPIPTPIDQSWSETT